MHTHFNKKKKLHVILKNGKRFVDKLKTPIDGEKKAEFRKYGNVSLKDIRSISYYRRKYDSNFAEKKKK